MTEVIAAVLGAMAGASFLGWWLVRRRMKTGMNMKDAFDDVFGRSDTVVIQGDGGPGEPKK